jgi:hypothetical protein
MERYENPPAFSGVPDRNYDKSQPIWVILRLRVKPGAPGYIRSYGVLKTDNGKSRCVVLPKIARSWKCFALLDVAGASAAQVSGLDFCSKQYKSLCTGRGCGLGEAPSIGMIGKISAVKYRPPNASLLNVSLSKQLRRQMDSIHTFSCRLSLRYFTSNLCFTNDNGNLWNSDH